MAAPSRRPRPQTHPSGQPLVFPLEMPAPPQLISLPEAQRWLGVSPETVARLLCTGRLPVVHMRRKARIQDTALLAWFAEQGLLRREVSSMAVLKADGRTIPVRGVVHNTPVCDQARGSTDLFHRLTSCIRQRSDGAAAPRAQLPPVSCGQRPSPAAAAQYPLAQSTTLVRGRLSK
jgi:excisionase family DNA binding protein